MSAPMRVLVIVPSYRPHASAGAFITTREYVLGLAASGHVVHVVTTGREPGQPRTEDGVKIWPIGHWWHAVRSARPELVISHHNDRRAAQILSQVRGVPHVLMVHGMARSNRRLGAPALAWFPSRACRDYYPTYRGRTLVLPPPIRPDAYRTTPGDMVLLSGSTAAKGADVLAQVAARMPSTRFLMVRTPWAQQVPVHAPNVEVVDRGDPRSVYGRARAVLMPSSTESYGRVGVEAMLSGIPVIASPLPGMREAFGDAAAYVPRDDPDGWVRELRRLEDPDAYAQASSAARAHADSLDYAANLAEFENACLRLRRPTRTRASTPARRRSAPSKWARDVIAWVHFGVPYRRAGSETMLHTMMRELLQAGVDVEVICSDMPEAPAAWEVDGVPYTHRTPREAEAVLRAARPGVVVTHHDHAERAILAAKGIQARSVLLLHSDFDLVARPLSRNPDLCIYNTQWVRKSLAGRFPQVDRGRSLIIHPPVIPDEHATATAGDRVTLVNLNRDKGVDTWHGAARLLPEVPFLGVRGGHGPQIEHGAPPNAELAPQTSDMRGDVWARTRVLMVPSRYESFGMAAVEALASGIPVIAHPTPGLREALGDGATFIDRDDHQAWADAIRGLYPDGPRRAEASAAARDRSAFLAGQSRAELSMWVDTVRGMLA